MSAEYRQLRPDELDRFIEVDATAFAMGDNREQGAEWYRRMRPDWTVVADLDGQIQASVTTLPLLMYIEGSQLNLGGVTSVSCMPEYRRQGHVGALLKRSLQLMKERDDTVGGLYTPHNALYRRYGWENCSESTTYEFHPKNVRLRDTSRPAGRAVRADVDRWEEFDAVYRRFALPRNGHLRRGRGRWTIAFQGGFDFKPGQAFLWQSPDGSHDGYVLLREQARPGHDGNEVFVRELVSLNSDALRGLLLIVLSFDLATRISWRMAIDEPLYDVFDDPLPLQRSAGWHHLLRIVDLEPAWRSRPCYERGEVVVEVRDRDCPWNEGHWRIASDGQRFAAERTEADPAVSLDINALAQVFCGHRTLSELARIGRATVRGEDPYAFDDLFRTRFRPYTSDVY